MTAPTPAELSRVAERRRALRALLARPLLLARHDPDAFAAAVRHRAELTRWFAEYPGWTLLVDPAAGHARLLKRAARRDATRPARAPGKGAFDRRRYTLLCLALAALDRSGPQVTLARLAAAVREVSLEEPALAAFDPDAAAERHAFVDALRLLVELGVLSVRDGDADGYARGRAGADALYDVQERLLGQLVAAPLPPALAGTPERMAEEERAQTEEGARLRARQQVFRLLLEDPVVYLDDLDARSREWLGHGSGFVYERLEQDVGLLVERRAEGLAGVDPEGTLTDTAFPEGSSTVKHAALLLCEWLTDRARAGRTDPMTPGDEHSPALAPGREVTPPPAPSEALPPFAPSVAARSAAKSRGAPDAPIPPPPPVPWPELVARIAALRADCGAAWSKEYGGPDGDERLARDGAAVLEAFGLAVRTAEGVAARPAAARFAPGPPAR